MSSNSKGGGPPKYDPAFKIRVAREYLTSSLGYGGIAKKYEISRPTIVYFVKWYRKKYPDALKVQGCLVALKKALTSLSNPDGLIHHSDRGIQYCCEPYVAVLQSHGIRISMTQSGSPYENAIAERVNGILKAELRLDKTFASYSAAVPEVHKAIDLYNRLRPHMSCNYQTPGQVHMQASP